MICQTVFMDNFSCRPAFAAGLMDSSTSVSGPSDGDFTIMLAARYNEDEMKVKPATF